MTYQLVDEKDDDPLVGAVLDERFRIDTPLSEGGMGKVYRGLQVGVEREVAIKVLDSDSSGGENEIRRFLREARTISQLSHPNIVNFIDFGQDPEHDALYLVMELIRGCELSALVKGRRLHPRLVIEITQQICSALAEPHHKGVIHRDLKPANLMLLTRLDGSVQVKLVDFGIANAVHQKTRLTQTGVACGTPHYMSPEQVDGEEITASTDIYGLGAIVYRMLTGRVLFDAGTDIQILVKHLQEERPDLRELPYADEIPDPMIDLVHTMLAKSPDERPESVLAIRDELEAIQRHFDFGEFRADPDLGVEEALRPWVLEVDSTAGALVSGFPETGANAASPQTGDEADTTAARTETPASVRNRVREPAVEPQSDTVVTAPPSESPAGGEPREIRPDEIEPVSPDQSGPQLRADVTDNQANTVRIEREEEGAETGAAGAAGSKRSTKDKMPDVSEDRAPVTADVSTRDVGKWVGIAIAGAVALVIGIGALVWPGEESEVVIEESGEGNAAAVKNAAAETEQEERVEKNPAAGAEKSTESPAEADEERTNDDPTTDTQAEEEGSEESDPVARPDESDRPEGRTPPAEKRREKSESEEPESRGERQAREASPEPAPENDPEEETSEPVFEPVETGSSSESDKTSESSSDDFEFEPVN